MLSLHLESLESGRVLEARLVQAGQRLPVPGGPVASEPLVAFYERGEYITVVSLVRLEKLDLRQDVALSWPKDCHLPGGELDRLLRWAGHRPFKPARRGRLSPLARLETGLGTSGA